jgi:hypothetical protein
MLNRKLLSALKVLTQKFDKENIKWVIVGSASLALQGVKVKPGDIDIMTDKEGSEKMNTILAEYLIRPITYGKTDRFDSYFGEFNINGIKVEVMGDFKEKIKNKWVSLDYRLKENKKINVKGIEIPVSLLTDQLESYESSERRKDFVRTRKIKEALYNKYLHNHQTNIQTFMF